MESKKRILIGTIVSVFVLGCMIGCKQQPPTQVAQSPTPPAAPPPPPPSPGRPCPTTGEFPANCRTSIPADTPITISGGSIHVTLNPPFQALDVGNKMKFTATSNNSGWLLFDGFVAAPGSGPLPGSQQFSGWVMRISNRSRQNGEKPEAIRICSNMACDGASVDPNNVVYLTVRPGSWMEIPDNTHLIFHDSECDTGAHPGENRQCDFFSKVRVKSRDLTSDLVGKCSLAGNDGQCFVGIGKP